MNHPLTIGGLLLGIGVISGLLMAAFGALLTFAAGMSDAGDDSTGATGCALFVAGAACTIGCLIGLFA
jgi:hypothetical protein